MEHVNIFGYLGGNTVIARSSRDEAIQQLCEGVITPWIASPAKARNDRERQLHKCIFTLKKQRFYDKRVH